MRWGSCLLAVFLALSTPAPAQTGDLPVFRVGPDEGVPRARGAFLAQEIKAQFPDLEQRYDAFLADHLTEAQAEAWIAQDFSALRDSLSTDLREEIDGLADGLALGASDRPGDGVLSFEEFWLLQAAPSLIPMNRGAAFGVDAPLTSAGVTLAGRVLDGEAARSLRDLFAITIVEDGPKTVVLIGPAGMAGVTNGYNAHGVFTALIDGPGSAPAAHSVGVAALDLREALTGARGLDSVVARLQGEWRRDRLIFLADPDRARVLEAPTGERPRLRGPDTPTVLSFNWKRDGQVAAVGCFALPRASGDCHDLTDIYRWVRLRDLAVFTASAPKAGLGDLIAILSDRADGHHGLLGPETAALIAFETRPPMPYVSVTEPFAGPRRYGGLIAPAPSGLLAWLLEGVWLGIALTIVLGAAALLYARFRR